MAGKQPDMTGRERHQSLVKNGTHKKAGGVMIGLLAVAAMVLVWLSRQDETGRTEQPETDAGIATRKPVPALPVASVAEPVIEEQVPALVPYREEPEDDPEMDDARMKSAIVAHNLDENAELPEQDDDKGPQDENSQFARSVSGMPVRKSQAVRLGNLEYKVLQGKMIEAVLEPRATSDLPGMVCATVQKDVYGSSGRVKLIPWGSRVCGVYSAELKKGQGRLFTVWNTLRRPDGVEVALDSIGSDQLGTAGMGGYVNTHFAQIFGISALLSIIGAGAGNGGGYAYPNSQEYYRQSVQQAASQTASKVLEPYINIMPTIEVPAGSRIRIYVNRDLDFTGAYAEADPVSGNGTGVMIVQ